MHVASSFNWAFSGSLYGLGRKREFRCFSPVSRTTLTVAVTAMFCSHHDGILTSEHQKNSWNLQQYTGFACQITHFTHFVQECLSEIDDVTAMLQGAKISNVYK